MGLSGLLRERGGHDAGKVAMVELFFDLVFVFAITQLSHGLLADLSVQGLVHTAVLFMGVWWLWIFTSWITNWLNPERISVRWMLFALMLCGLLLSSSIPEAFGEKGWLFGCMFAAMQIGRTLFMLAACMDNVPLRRNFQRVLAWLCLSGVLWVCGGFAPEQQRLWWWGVALLIEYLAPPAYFWVPGLGRSLSSDWNIDGGHMAERCMLFVIIALGESILVTGATFAELAIEPATVVAFVSCFLGSLAMWWVYFDTGAERAAHRISHSSDPGRIARLSYNYLHLLIIFGIILCAVADEIVLVHPGHADALGTAILLLGPALYLLGNALFKWVSNHRRLPPFSHLVGLTVLVGLVPLAFKLHLSPFWLSLLSTGVLVLVAVWESLALRRPA